jgi:hypothetical protein
MIDDLIKFLVKNDFQVTRRPDLGSPNYYSVETDKLQGGFSDWDDEINPYINHTLCIDRKDCFDKWSKCPFGMDIEVVLNNKEKVLEFLKFLETEKGKEFSDNYGYYEDWSESYD